VGGGTGLAHRRVGVLLRAAGAAGDVRGLFEGLLSGLSLKHGWTMAERAAPSARNPHNPLLDHRDRQSPVLRVDTGLAEAPSAGRGR